MGSTSTKVSLAEFTAYSVRDGLKKNKTVGQVEIKSVAWDETLGGYAFEMKIVDFCANELQKLVDKKYPGANVRENARTMAKIRAQAEKAKKVLSANQETPIYVESAYKDVDLRTSLKREKFNEISNDLVQRITVPLNQVLTEQSLSPSDVEVFIIGGATRIPIVHQTLKSFTQRELGMGLDGDEAIAMGTVFRAANLSTAFQVRQIGRAVQQECRDRSRMPSSA
eukprot:TRINITY_DN14118_c0_g1_i1.p1 TRINITY_DN14118_c0_g1~~TRINITY_DN14118_c0_g1_i1.p1  ORF type:complete len:225 (+),score=34.79 TRINITY_DN14118_c0_g1_i1:107-781(+)